MEIDWLTTICEDTGARHVLLLKIAVTLFTTRSLPVEIGPLFFDIRESAVIQSSFELILCMHADYTFLHSSLFVIFLWFSEIHPTPLFFHMLALPVDHPLSIDVC